MKKRAKNSTHASALQVTLALGLLSLGAIWPLSLSQSKAETGERKKSQPLQAASAQLFAQLTPRAARATFVPGRQLTLTDRVAYQYAIEEVYWRHRIWPSQNTGPKPPLDQVLSEAQVEEKVQSYLRDSQLLAEQWQRPITHEQLQAEMNRMASQSKQPEVLADLFDALGNDPAVIAECLARPVLAERLVRERYAHDESLHGALRARAESELQAHPGVTGMAQTSGTYSEMEWRKSAPPTPSSGVTGGNDSAAAAGESAGAVQMSGSEWNQSIAKLAGQFENTGRPRGSGVDGPGGAFARLQIGVVSGLQEDDSHYYATAVLEKGNDRLKVATVAWAKEPFEAWAARQEAPTSQVPLSLSAGYTLPQIDSPADGCAHDNWSEEAIDGAPAGRRLHTAVWTGTEMIVWGGVGGVNFASGGRYNPSTDSWVATSTTNAPAARSGHTAVWTGTEMIVWGGGSGFNTGGRYNPSTDSWVATSTTNAPAGRNYHTAVWTGSEMIVWGGDNGGYLNTGGRYNPSTNSWVATSSSNAPAGRSYHTAVWTGSEMIVWGGLIFSGGNDVYFNSGGRYNPSTDSWVATNTFAPEARFAHTAVWTGTEMIVWGGEGTAVFSTLAAATIPPQTLGLRPAPPTLPPGASFTQPCGLALKWLSGGEPTRPRDSTLAAATIPLQTAGWPLPIPSCPLRAVSIPPCGRALK